MSCACGKIPTSGGWRGGIHTGFSRGVHCAKCTLRSKSPARTDRTALPVVRPACAHEGAVLEFCPTCHSSAEGRHVRDCDLHERCTRSRVGPHVRACADCSDYEPGGVRNLIYHVYPVSGNGAWQWNVDQLVKRIPLFNGVRAVAIVTDPPLGRLPAGPPTLGRHIAPCDSPEVVKERFGELARRVTFLEMENDPDGWEGSTLHPLLGVLLAKADPDSVTLYAQAKGTTRPVGHISRRWTEVLYETLFDHWPEVNSVLEKHPVAGSFKKVGMGWSRGESESPWHYSGSWFWFRNRDLFARDWRSIDRFWGAVESYPGRMFSAMEAGCVFHENMVQNMNLYNANYWARVVEPAYAKWKDSKRSARYAPWG